MSSTVFVLSAGRTGTVFLTRTLPAHVPGIDAEHEAPGSRATLMLGNARALAGGGGAPLLERRVRAMMERQQHRAPDARVWLQINPMLVPVTDLLPRVAQPLRVVHMTRHPVSWVQSIRAFKASTRFRPFIDHIPLATPYPAPRPPGWLGLDRVSRALHRWTYCNQQILAVKPQCDTYTHIRYEDLFHADPETQRHTLERLTSTMGVPMPEAPEQLFTAQRANPSPEGQRVEVPTASVQRICGPLLDLLGYSPAP